MREKIKIFNFYKKRARKESRIKNIDGIKYFTSDQIRLLRRTVRDKALLALQKNQVTAIKEWIVIDLLTNTGLRVSEAANLKIKHLKINNGDNRILIENGKGGISGHIVIPDCLKTNLRKFLKWKKEHGESIDSEAWLFTGQRGHWTRQAISQIVKKYLKKLGLYEKNKAVHSLRHSYGVQLYGKEKDLRCVQKQLRHVSIQSTLIYADVNNEAIAEQVTDLWR